MRVPAKEQENVLKIVVRAIGKMQIGQYRVGKFTAAALSQRKRLPNVAKTLKNRE